MAETAVLGPDQMQALRKRPVQARRVEVPEWGGAVFVRMLSGTERDDYESTIAYVGKSGKTERNVKNLRGRFAALVLAHADGRRMWQDSDAAWLGQLDAAGLDRVYDAAAELNRMSKGDEEQAEKNSGGGGPPGSTSSSPGGTAAPSA
jgi:hypothetical protein